MGQFSNSFPKHFSYLCEYAIRFDLSCSYCEYPAIFHCLHCSPSCFGPDSLLLASLWLGLSWIDCISANKSFSFSRTSSTKPYTSSKQQERHKHSVEITINFSYPNTSHKLKQGLANLRQKPGPNTHAVDPGHEWQDQAKTHAHTHTPQTPAKKGKVKAKHVPKRTPQTPATTSGVQVEPVPKETGPLPQPSLAGSRHNRFLKAHNTNRSQECWH